MGAWTLTALMWNSTVMKTFFLRVISLVLLHLLVFTFGAASVSAYNYTGYKWSGTSTSYYINNAFAASFITGMNAADATWDAAGSRFRFTYVTTGSRNPNTLDLSTYTKDTYNDIGYYNDGAGDIAYTACHVSGTTITECDITLNIYYGFTTVGAAGKYDLQSIVTHEFGHFLFLDHVTSSRSPSYCRTTSLATMCKYPYSTGDTYWRSLTTDDKNGIKAIYGT